MSHKPVYRALFSFQDARGRSGRFGDLGVSQVHVLPPVAANDVSLWIMEKESGFIGGLNYSTELFDEPTMVRFLSCFRTLLQGIAADPGRRVSRLPLALGDGASVLEGEGASTPGLLAPFDAHASTSPDAIAVVQGDGKLTYGALRDAAAELAQRLGEAGAGPGCRIAQVAEASVESLLGMLAVARIGAVLVPIDPSMPDARRARLLQAARPKLVLAGAGAGRPGVAPVLRVEFGQGAGGPPPAPGATVLLLRADPRGGLETVEIDRSVPVRRGPTAWGRWLGLSARRFLPRPPGLRHPCSGWSNRSWRCRSEPRWPSTRRPSGIPDSSRQA